MRLTRLYTQKDTDPLQAAPIRAWQDADWLEYIVPRAWGRAAAEVLAAEVFCSGGIPALLKPLAEDGVPEFLWRRVADDAGLDGISAEWRTRGERDFREVFSRIAGGLAYHAWKAGIFDSAEDARVFYDELRHILLHQMAAPEMALLAKAGLDWAYGLDAKFTPAARIISFSDASGDVAGASVAVDTDSPPKNILKRLKLLAQQQSIDGGRVCVTLPVENIDSPAFVSLQRQEDIDSVAAELGRKTLQSALHLVMDACDRDSVFGFDPARNGKLFQALQAAKRAGVNDAALNMAIHYAQQGYEEIPLAPAEEEERTQPLSATLSVPDDFIERALTGHGFMLAEAGEPQRHYPAEKLWNSVGAAIWSSGEPALFFRDSAASSSALQEEAGALSNSGQGGLIFLPDTAAPAATINLAKFPAAQGLVDAASLSHAVKIIAIALEASFAAAQATPAMLQYRPLAIGVTGIAGLLMGNALAYDSDAGRASAALVVALVSGAAFDASAEIAASIGACAGYTAMEKPCLQNLKDKMSALAGTSYMQKGVARRPVQLNTALCPDAGLVDAVKSVWGRAYVAGKEKGFRHAHLTSLDTAPALQTLLAAPTRDLAPESALVRFEGYFADGVAAAELYGKKFNPAAPRALGKMGFTAQQADDIGFYAAGHGTLFGAPAINHISLKSKGFHQGALDALEAALGSAQHIRYVFNKWTLGDEFCTRMLGFTAEELASGAFDMLTALGFSEDDIDDANLYCCGAMTLEGAPHLLPKHLAVFDCLAPAAAGVRRVSPEAQIKMQAAIEPFLSGAACHTVELRHYTSVDDVQKLVLLGWELGVKRLRLYRDGCSIAHPVVLPLADTAAEPEAADVPRIRVAS